MKIQRTKKSLKYDDGEALPCDPEVEALSTAVVRVREIFKIARKVEFIEHGFFDNLLANRPPPDI
jgi:hypothetical protein